MKFRPPVALFTRHVLLTAVGLASSMALLFGSVPHASAQLADEEMSAEERAKQFDSLAQEVGTLERQGNILKKVAKLASPSVVHIEAEKIEQLKVGSRTKKSVEEAGSGVVIELAGRNYILTNRHVVKSAQLNHIRIKLADGREINPTSSLTDPGTDVAVMTINATHLVPARIGDSDRMDIGDFVLAVGSPFGLSHSVTFGIISAKGRRDLELGEGVRFQDFMQTDAAINPGNSGGPLINLRGEVIGLNTAIASSSGGSEGIGFTIPINMAMVVAKQLIEHGSVVRAFLGVTLDSKFSSATATRLGLPRVQGTRISAVTPSSPAEAARLQVDDVILEYNGVRVEDDNHLVNLVSLTEVGKVVPVTVFRGQQLVKLGVKVGRNAIDLKD